MKILHKTCLLKFSFRDKTSQPNGEKCHMIQPRKLRGYRNFSKLIRSISRHTEVRRRAMSRRHLLTLETTVFTAAWILPTASSVVLRGITRTWAFTFPTGRKKKSSYVDPTNKDATQLALRVQRTFTVYVVLNHRWKCSPQFAAAPWIRNHVRLTARGKSSTAPVEQFL